MKKLLLFIILLIPVNVAAFESSYDISAGDSIDLNYDFSNYYFRYSNPVVSHIENQSLEGLTRGINTIEIFDNNDILRHKINSYVDSNVYYEKLFNFLNNYTFAIDMKYITTISNEEVTQYISNYLSELYYMDLDVMFKNNYILSCNINSKTCQISHKLYSAIFNIVFDGIYIENNVINLNIGDTYSITYTDYNDDNPDVYIYKDNMNNTNCTIDGFTITASKKGVCQFIIENDYGEYNYLDVLVGIDTIKDEYIAKLSALGTINTFYSPLNTSLSSKKEKIIEYLLRRSVAMDSNIKANYEIRLVGNNAYVKVCPFYNFYKSENNINRIYNYDCTSEVTIPISYKSSTSVNQNEVETLAKQISLERYVDIEDFFHFINTNVGANKYLVNCEEISFYLIVANNISSSDTYEKYLVGDVDLNGRLTINDVIGMRKHLAGIKTLTGNNLETADVDKNGRVTINDVIKMRKHLAGIELIQNA